MAIQDTNIEQQSGWGFHLGGNIGGVAPASFTLNQDFASNPDIGAIMNIVGIKGEYADGEAYINRPILPNSGNLDLIFRMAVSPGYAVNSQATEKDIRISLPNGTLTNNSFQINNALGGVAQISGPDGEWVTVPNAKPGIFPARSWHDFAFQYWFNTLKNLYGTSSFTIDGNTYTVPSNMQGLTASVPMSNGKPAPWTPGSYFQWQMDSNANGGQHSEILQGITNIWS